MKRIPTLFLQLVIIGIGLGALAFFIFAVPAIGKGIAGEFSQLAYLRYPVMIGMWAVAIPFFIILHQGLVLLRSIDANTIFSDASIRVLRRIKRCAIVIGIICL